MTNGQTLQQASCLLPDSSQAAQAESLGVEQKGRFSTLDFPACSRTLWLSNLKERANDGSLKDSCMFYQAKIVILPQILTEPLLCARCCSREQLDKKSLHVWSLRAREQRAAINSTNTSHRMGMFGKCMLQSEQGMRIRPMGSVEVFLMSGQERPR